MSDDVYLWKLNYLDWDLETELSRLELNYDPKYERQHPDTEMTIVTWGQAKNTKDSDK